MVDHEKTLIAFIFDYMLRQNHPVSARSLASELGLTHPSLIHNPSAHGCNAFLVEWWDLFLDVRNYVQRIQGNRQPEVVRTPIHQIGGGFPWPPLLDHSGSASVLQNGPPNVLAGDGVIPGDSPNSSAPQLGARFLCPPLPKHPDALQYLINVGLIPRDSPNSSASQSWAGFPLPPLTNHRGSVGALQNKPSDDLVNAGFTPRDPPVNMNPGSNIITLYRLMNASNNVSSNPVMDANIGYGSVAPQHLHENFPSSLSHASPYDMDSIESGSSLHYSFEVSQPTPKRLE